MLGGYLDARTCCVEQLYSLQMAAIACEVQWRLTVVILGFHARLEAQEPADELDAPITSRRVNRKVAVGCGHVNTRTRLVQQLRRLKVATVAGKVQRRLTVVILGCRARTKAEEPLDKPDVSATYCCVQRLGFVVGGCINARPCRLQQLRNPQAPTSAREVQRRRSIAILDCGTGLEPE